MSPLIRDIVDRAYAARRAGDATGSLALYQEAARGAAQNAEARAHCLRHVGDLAREMALPDVARTALAEAETLYRGPVHDTLSLANTVRMRALLEGDKARWREAKTLYQRAADETGFDLSAAYEECDRQIGLD